MVQKIFRWIAVAQRPLTLDELGQAVSINIGQTDWNPERQVQGIRRIRLWSNNLVQTTDEEPPSVQFAHSSIREYLTKANWPPGLTDFHVDLERAERYAGEICVTFLHFGVFKTTLARRLQPVRVQPVALARAALSREPKIRRVSNLLTDIAFRQRKAANDPDLRKAVSDSESGNGDDSVVSLQQSHPFLTYATLYWLHHTTHFQKGEPIMLQSWYDILDGGSYLAYQPWKDALFRKRWLLRPEDNKGPVDYGWQHTEDSLGKRAVVRSDDIVRLTNASDSEDQLSRSWVYIAMLIWSYEMHRYDLLQYASSKLRVAEKSDLSSLMQRAVYESNEMAIAALLESVIWPKKLLDHWLYNACDVDDPKVAEQLLNAGALWKTNPSFKRRRALLAAASQGGHLEVVRLLLNDGVDVHAHIPEKHTTPVYLACESGHSEVVRLLLGARPNVKVSPYGRIAITELQIASEKGNPAMVRLLLDAGADVNQVVCSPRDSITALQSACRYGRFDIVKLLLCANANVNAPGAKYQGYTAIQAASLHGSVEIIQLLLDAGANVNAPGAKYKGYTAIQAASLHGRVEIIQLLLDAGANVNAPPSFYNGYTALQAASTIGSVDAVRCLLRANVDVNAGACEVEGTMALLAAAGGGHLEIVSCLLDAGADINALHFTSRGGDGDQASNIGTRSEALQKHLDFSATLGSTFPRYTELSITIMAEPISMNFMKRSVHHESIPNADKNLELFGTPFDRQTALQAAAAHGHVEVVQRLLDSDADVDAVGSVYPRHTALQAAAAHGHVEVVQRLLDSGAHGDAVGSVYPRHTALQAAAANRHHEVVQLIIDSGAVADAVGAVYPGSSMLRDEVAKRQAKYVQPRLHSDADLKAFGSIISGHTALQAAAAHGHIEVVQRLLDSGVDVDAPGSIVSGRTALQVAADYGNIEVVQQLLDANADVNIPASEEDVDTALRSAARNGNLKIVELLLGAKANANAPVSEWQLRMAMREARKRGHSEIYTVLLKAATK